MLKAGGGLVTDASLCHQEEVDAGAIIVQEAVPVLGSDTEDTLSDRIREAEHRAFPAAMELVASGTVKLGEDGHISWQSELEQEKLLFTPVT